MVTRLIVHRQRRGDLGTDEAAADHDELRCVAGWSLDCESAHSLVILEGAIVDDAAVGRGAVLNRRAGAAGNPPVASSSLS